MSAQRRRSTARPVSLGHLPKAEKGRSSVQVALEHNEPYVGAERDARAIRAKADEVEELLSDPAFSGLGGAGRPSARQRAGRPVPVEYLALIGAVSGLGALAIEFAWVVSGLVR